MTAGKKNTFHISKQCLKEDLVYTELNILNSKSKCFFKLLIFSSDFYAIELVHILMIYKVLYRTTIDQQKEKNSLKMC